MPMTILQTIAYVIVPGCWGCQAHWNYWGIGWVKNSQSCGLETFWRCGGIEISEQCWVEYFQGFWGYEIKAKYHGFKTPRGQFSIL